MIHDLKCASGYFRAVKSGKKPFEVRFDDRGYTVGDILRLREWTGKRFTGDEYVASVTYILRGPEYCKPGYCVMGIQPVSGTVEERMRQVQICLTDEDKRRPGVQWLLVELERVLLQLERAEARR